HCDAVVCDLLISCVPDRLRSDTRLRRQRLPGLRLLRLRSRYVGWPARHGSGSGADHAAGSLPGHHRPDLLSEAGVMVGGRRFGSRLLRLYLPLAVCLILMLFPFYWMLVTSIK